MYYLKYKFKTLNSDKTNTPIINYKVYILIRLGRFI